ncbi:cyclin-H isoform X6 [Myotis lucifugus]|uniref:cyclin-H isoform X6 n=1 Tax=Myotis lucifugus TaxID=59463 RepID=UPI000CCC1136|nr:cyclin-H isoform X6 [Myotis lucifugus]
MQGGGEREDVLFFYKLKARPSTCKKITVCFIAVVWNGTRNISEVLPNDPVFLEPHEEMTLCKYYEKRLLEFCSVFKPAMPRSVVGTACMYFKRFYLNNSVMEYHPRIIMLTCAFLACKVDEFNVSSLQFVGNLRESPLGQEKALEQILEYELLLIQQLNFHLIVHNPYRPFEGFLIDLKTRYPMLENPEILRKTADDFLNRVALTDAYLLYTPSQIALTAILSSASRAGITMESYLSESLMLKENRTCLSQLLDVMKSMRNLVKKYEPPRPEEVAVLKQKLERCHSAELALNVITFKILSEDQVYCSKLILTTLGRRGKAMKMMIMSQRNPNMRRKNGLMMTW